MAPAIVTPELLSRRETAARGSGLLAVSTILPRISRDGCGAAGGVDGGPWAATVKPGTANEVASSRVSRRDK
jgi:hypothetical protein